MDWICDICNKPESETGYLITGRAPGGRDFQICKSCADKHDLKTSSDVENHSKLEEE